MWHFHNKPGLPGFIWKQSYMFDSFFSQGHFLCHLLSGFGAFPSFLFIFCKSSLEYLQGKKKTDIKRIWSFLLWEVCLQNLSYNLEYFIFVMKEISKIEEQIFFFWLYSLSAELFFV